MNNTNISKASSPYDAILASFKNSYTVVQIYFWGYLILFLFGFTGNIASLLTFSRPTLRNISTGCLLIILAISDTIYLFDCIIDFVEFGLQVIFVLNHSYYHILFILIYRFKYMVK